MGQFFVNNQPVPQNQHSNTHHPPVVNRETASYRNRQATGGDGGVISAAGQSGKTYNFLTDTQSGLTLDVSFTAIGETHSIPPHDITAPTQSTLFVKGINDIGIPEEVKIQFKADGSATLFRRNPPATDFVATSIAKGEEIRLPDHGTLQLTTDGHLILNTTNGVTINQVANQGILESTVSATADRLGSFKGFLGQSLDADKTANNDFKQGIDAFNTTPPVVLPLPGIVVAPSETASLTKTGFGTYAANGGDGGQAQVPVPGPGIFNLLKDKDVTFNAQVAGNSQIPNSEAPRAPELGITNTAITIGGRVVSFTGNGQAVLGSANPQIKIASILLTVDKPVSIGDGVTAVLKADKSLVITTPEYEITQKVDAKGFISATVKTNRKGVLGDGVAPTGFLGQTFDKDKDKTNDFKQAFAKFEVGNLVPVPNDSPPASNSPLNFSVQELQKLFAEVDTTTVHDPGVPLALEGAGSINADTQRGSVADGKITAQELDAFLTKTNQRILQLQTQIKFLERLSLGADGPPKPGLLGGVADLKGPLTELRKQLEALERKRDGARLLKDNFGLFSTNIRGIGNPPAGGLPTAVILVGDLQRVAANVAPTDAVTQEDLDAEQKKLPGPGEVF